MFVYATTTAEWPLMAYNKPLSRDPLIHLRFLPITSQ